MPCLPGPRYDGQNESGKMHKAVPYDGDPPMYRLHTIHSIRYHRYLMSLDTENLWYLRYLVGV